MLTLQSHDWNNGTNGGHQLEGGDLKIDPIPDWMSLWPIMCHMGCCVCAWLLQGYPNRGFLLPPNPDPPTLRSSNLTHPSVSFTDIRKEWQNYLEIQP